MGESKEAKSLRPPSVFKKKNNDNIYIPVWKNKECQTDLGKFLTWSRDNDMNCNLEKCKELIFRKKGFNQVISSVYNIPQCSDISVLGMTLQENCKYSLHIKAKLLKANRCLYVIRSLRKEGACQEVDKIFNSLVLPIFTYCLSVYGASDSDLTVVQKFLDRCFKRRYVSHCINLRELLEANDKKLYNKYTSMIEHPLSKILPKKKTTNYHLRKQSIIHPKINTNRFKNTFVNRLIFKYNL
ncbi:uncharacterized protein LOC114526631 [Dendronephthya gigantea]|uniref:uncharacterized protein LOC114526631 n=1 Tax=Dendronephthya gigantea TaxID=151771 RepID=UPI00106C1E51|nr:uncharacterized protein LOC114526631 [Dendronephthya gigantea]